MATQTIVNTETPPADLKNVISIVQTTMTEVRQLTNKIKTQVTSMNQFKKQVHDINQDILRNQEDVKGYIHLLNTIIESRKIKVNFLDSEIKCLKQTIDELKIKIIHINKGEEAAEIASGEEIKKLQKKIQELEESKKILEQQKKNALVEKTEAHKNVKQIQSDTQGLKQLLESQLNEIKQLTSGVVTSEGLVGGSGNPTPSSNQSGNPPAPTSNIVQPTPPNQPQVPKINPKELGIAAKKMQEANKNRMDEMAKAKEKEKISSKALLSNKNKIELEAKKKDNAYKKKSTEDILKDLQKIKSNASQLFSKVSTFIEYTLKIDVSKFLLNEKFKKMVIDGSIPIDFGVIDNNLNEIYKNKKVFILGKNDKNYKVGKYFYYDTNKKESKFIDEVVIDKGVTHVFDNRNLFIKVTNNKKYIPIKNNNLDFNNGTDKQPEWQLKWCKNKETKKLEPMYYSIKGDYYQKEKPAANIFADDNYAVEGPSCKCMTQDELKAAKEDAKLAKAKIMPNFGKNIEQSASKRNAQQEAIRKAKKSKGKIKLMESIKSKKKQQPSNSEGEIDLSINSDSIETPMLINYKFK